MYLHSPLASPDLATARLVELRSQAAARNRRLRRATPQPRRFLATVFVR